MAAADHGDEDVTQGVPFRLGLRLSRTDDLLRALGNGALRVPVGVAVFVVVLQPLA